MSFFFEDMDERAAARSPRMLHRNMDNLEELQEDHPVVDDDPMKRAETLELVRAYYKIPNRVVAKKLFDAIVLLSKSTYNLPNSDENDDE